jgi:uncharacterized protein with FMN-binding domain
VILSIVGTVVALVALLSFKSHSPVTAAAGGLPAASLGGPAGGAVSSSAPPNPGSNASSPAAVPPSTPPRVPGSTTPSATAGSAGTRTTVGAAVTTRYGIVQIKLVTSGTAIQSVSFVQLTAYDDRSAQINADAAPLLLQQTLSAQSANIDGVSGATYTSQGYQQSLQSALDQAGVR